MRYFNPSAHPQLRAQPDLFRAREAVHNFLWLLNQSYGLSTEAAAEANLLKDLLFARVFMDKHFEEDKKAIEAVSDELGGGEPVKIGKQPPQDSYAMALLDLATWVRNWGLPPSRTGKAIQLIVDAAPTDMQADYMVWATQACAILQALLSKKKEKYQNLPKPLQEICDRVNRTEFNELVKEIKKKVGEKTLFLPLYAALGIEPEELIARLNGEFREALRNRRWRESPRSPEQGEMVCDDDRQSNRPLGAPRKNVRAVDLAIEIRQQKPKPSWKAVWAACKDKRDDKNQDLECFKAAVLAQERKSRRARKSD